jgi:hypothetical protein
MLEENVRLDFVKDLRYRQRGNVHLARRFAPKPGQQRHIVRVMH